MVSLAAQDLGADGVEGADGQAPQPAAAGRLRRVQHAVAQDAFGAAAHLARGLVGEGDGHQPPRGHTALLHQVSHALGQDARLAGARPRQHQHRPVGRRHGCDLLFVETCQDVGHGVGDWEIG